MCELTDRYAILVRLGFLFLASLWLSLAAFNPTTAHFANMLQNQATARLVDSDNPVLLDAFYQEPGRQK